MVGVGVVGVAADSAEEVGAEAEGEGGEEGEGAEGGEDTDPRGGVLLLSSSTTMQCTRDRDKDKDSGALLRGRGAHRGMGMDRGRGIQGTTGGSLVLGLTTAMDIRATQPVPILSTTMRCSSPGLSTSTLALLSSSGSPGHSPMPSTTMQCTKEATPDTKLVHRMAVWDRLGTAVTASMAGQVHRMAVWVVRSVLNGQQMLLVCLERVHCMGVQSRVGSLRRHRCSSSRQVQLDILGLVPVHRMEVQWAWVRRRQLSSREGWHTETEGVDEEVEEEGGEGEAEGVEGVEGRGSRSLSRALGEH